MTGQLTGLESVGVTVKISSNAPDNFTKFQQTSTPQLLLIFAYVIMLFQDWETFQIRLFSKYRL